MLLSFRFENYRSFAGEAELSLVPAGSASKDALTVAAVFGANASGKSNLLRALNFMASAVYDSYRRWPPEGGVPRSAFRLDPETLTAPSTFVVELLIDHVRFNYGFVLDDDVVREEWLYSYPKGRRRLLFERDRSGPRFGTTLSEGQTRASALADLTRSNALFLSVAAQTRMPEVMPVWSWFSRLGQRRPGQSFINPRRIARLLDGEDAAQFRSLLRLADLGISDVLVQTDPPESSNRRDVDADGRVNDPGPALLTKPDQRLMFGHGPSGSLFDVSEESDGTRSWVSLLPDVLSALKTGSILLIDELDASLHPYLSAELVGIFQSDETNPHNAQLVFTTHDATLLATSFDEELLHRDQIWFVEKSSDGASHLFPLSDFHPRKGENRQKRYLGGSYGAVPVISMNPARGSGHDQAS